MVARMLIALTFAAAFGVFPASANERRNGSMCSDYGGYGAPNCGSSYSGGNPSWYCPPGQIPQVFPNGNGYRCQEYDGRY